jgi:hypothetical protein
MVAHVHSPSLKRADVIPLDPALALARPIDPPDEARPDAITARELSASRNYM